MKEKPILIWTGQWAVAKRYADGKCFPYFETASWEKSDAIRKYNEIFKRVIKMHPALSYDKKRRQKELITIKLYVELLSAKRGKAARE